MQSNIRSSIILLPLLCASLALPVGAQPLTSPPADGQVIKDEGGSVFMEEVLPAKPKSKPSRQKGNVMPNGLPLDLSNIGVKVDPRGNIIPLINKDTPGDVQPLYSQTTVTRETPYPYFVGPAGGVTWGPPGYYPGYPGWTGPWNPYAPPAYRYVSPQGVTPWQTPYGPIAPYPYPSGMFTNPLVGPGLSTGFRIGNFGGGMFLPSVRQFQSTSTITPLFNSPVLTSPGP